LPLFPKPLFPLPPIWSLLVLTKGCIRLALL
jgi:hypothetical protein